MRVAVLFALGLVACSSGATQAGGQPRLGGGRRWLPVPPKPGASITDTRLCSCRSCLPASCCEGPDDSPSNGSACDSYDFSSCGMSVQSCTSRCFRHVWRVKSSESCSARRPDECCYGT
jgi:hypothetical protein